MKNSNPLFSFFKYIRNAKKEYIFGSIFVVISIFVEVYGTKVISKVFDESYISTITKSAAFKYAVGIAGIYFALNIIQAIAVDLRRYYLTKASNTVYTSIQKKVYDHIQNLPISYFDNIPAGSVLSKITNDVSQIKNFFSMTLINFVTIILKIGLMLTILFLVNWRLSILILIIFPVIFIAQRIYHKKFYSLSVKFRKHNSSSLGMANEICQNLELIKTFNLEEYSLDEWNKEIEERYATSKKMSGLNSLLVFNLNKLLVVFVNFLVISYFVYSKYYHLELVTSAQVFIFIYYLGNIVFEMMNMNKSISVYTNALGASKNLSDILEMKEENETTKKKLDKFVGSVEFKHVGFYYKNEEYVLKDINLDIKENSTVAIIGHTGSGKSSIINLLIKFYEAQKGQIIISGEDIVNIDSEYLRDNISIVLQDSYLFEGTILSNICKDEKKAENALIKVGAKYILDERGINGKVLPDGSNFSTGEKQLICFARALAKDPKILILDEATSNVDSKTEQIIQKGIEILKQGRTTIVIAHRLSTIINSDNIYVLDKGEIIETGNHSELMALNGQYAKLIELDKS